MARFRALLLAASIVTSVASCDGSPVMPVSDLRSLAAAASRWEASAPAAYEFTYLRSCFCPVVTPLRVTVRDGMVVSARIIATGEELNLELTWVPTIDGIFAELARVLALPPARFDVRYDAARGFPVAVDVDQVEMMADDEFVLRLSDFKELA